MDNSPEANEHSNSNGENMIKAESNETVTTFGEDGLHYSDFENVEYEEVNEELINERQDDEYTSLNSLKSLSRKRTRNFTQNECNMLCTLIEDYSDILEVKRNDHKTNTLKNIAWVEITQKFNNSTSEEKRTALQLRTFYENLKKKRKKLFRETENGDVTNTSGHSSEDKTYSENHSQIKGPLKTPDSYRKCNFLEEYQRKKIELVEWEIKKVKSACEQQRRLFLLQEEKLMLEIEEIKERIRKK